MTEPSYGPPPVPPVAPPDVAAYFGPPAPGPWPPAPPAPPAPAAPPRRTGRTVAIVIGAGIVLLISHFVALLIGVMIGSAGSDPAPAVAPAAVTAAPSTPDLSGEAIAPPAAVTAPAPATVAPEPTPAPVGPYPAAAAFGEGMWLVGIDAEVHPGTYRSPGPTADDYPSCYVDTTAGDKIDEQEVSNAGPVRITVEEGQTINMSGCQQFVMVTS